MQIQTVDKHVAAKQAASDNVAADETMKAVVNLGDLPQYNPLHKRFVFCATRFLKKTSSLYKTTS